MRGAPVRTGTITTEKADRLSAIMTGAFPEAMVSNYQQLIPAMKNHEKDRHVAAAAVKAGAQVIVTANLKDFSNLPDGIEAQSPDEFLCNLFDLNPELMTSVLREQAADLKKPPALPRSCSSAFPRGRQWTVVVGESPRAVRSRSPSSRRPWRPLE